MIVALTALVLPEMKEKCFEVGMDEFISKPVMINELSEILGKY